MRILHALTYPQTKANRLAPEDLRIVPGRPPMRKMQLKNSRTWLSKLVCPFCAPSMLHKVVHRVKLARIPLRVEAVEI